MDIMLNILHIDFSMLHDNVYRTGINKLIIPFYHFIMSESIFTNVRMIYQRVFYKTENQ